MAVQGVEHRVKFVVTVRFDDDVRRAYLERHTALEQLHDGTDQHGRGHVQARKVVDLHAIAGAQPNTFEREKVFELTEIFASAHDLKVGRTKARLLIFDGRGAGCLRDESDSRAQSSGLCPRRFTEWSTARSPTADKSRKGIFVCHAVGFGNSITIDLRRRFLSGIKRMRRSLAPERVLPALSNSIILHS